MIQKQTVSSFDRIFSIMESSFPKEEYRSYEGQKALLLNPAYEIYAETDQDGGILAFIAVWNLDAFVFIEHLASDPDKRNLGLGSKLLHYVQGQTTKPLCLEVEPPETPLSIRRIGFYERNGFTLNQYPYVQPSLSQGCSSVPLQIMTTGGPVSQDTFIRIRNALYTQVYRCNGEDIQS